MIRELLGDKDELAERAKRVTREMEDIPEKKLKARRAELVALLAGMKAERDEERRLQKIAEETRSDEIKLRSKLERLREDVEKRKAQHDGIDSRIGEPCGECGKPYCEHDLEDARKIAKAGLRAAVDAFKRERASYDETRERSTRAADALVAYQATMTDAHPTNAEIEEIDTELRRMSELDKQYGTIALQIATIGRDVEKLEKAVNPFSALADKKVDAIEDSHRHREKKVEQIEKVQGEVQVAERVTALFSPAGVRAYILDTVTPLLNERTASYLGTLSDGAITATWTTLVRNAKGELREKFAIEVEHALGGEGFASLSGGEKRKVRIACALALQDLVASRASKPIDLFIGDEIDDALDAAGLERLMSILEEKARERGSVFIISHRSLRDWIREVVTIKKAGGVSVMA
jgi:DNA repair exonuclease SbcCD ATPase subunit